MAFLDDLQSWMTSAAQQFGVSKSYLATTAKLESGFDPNASGGGLYQFRGPAMEQVGLSNPLDPKASTFGAASFAAINTASLTNALGRAPEDWEVYLAHQQGAYGAARILKNPGQYAEDGVSNFKGNVNAEEFERITGLDVNNPFRPITNSDFATYWEKKYQAASGVTASLFNIPAFGGGDSERTTAIAAYEKARTVNPGAFSDVASSPGGDTSTWMGWLSHQAVRGTVVVTGFIFLGTGLGMFALSAIFRSDVGKTVIGSAIGGAVAGRAARAPRSDVEPVGASPLPDVEVTPLARQPDPPSGGNDDGGMFIDIMPDAPQLVPPSSGVSRNELEAAFIGLRKRANPDTQEGGNTPSIFREMEGSMKHYREYMNRNMHLLEDAGTPRERNVYGKTPKAKKVKPAPMFGSAETSDETARATVLTSAGRRQIAHGWNQFAASAAPKRKKAVSVTPLTDAEKKQASADMAKVGSKNKPALDPKHVDNRTLADFPGFKIGAIARIKPPTKYGKETGGRPIGEQVEILQIFEEVQRGVGVKVKSAKMGEIFLPADELEIDVRGTRRAKQKSLLHKLGVLRDWTKPKPKK